MHLVAIGTAQGDRFRQHSFVFIGSQVIPHVLLLPFTHSMDAT
jgi:hypothetical protein